MGRHSKAYTILSVEQRRELIELRREGSSLGMLANRFGVCETTASRICLEGEAGITKFSAWIESRTQRFIETPAMDDGPTQAAPGSAEKLAVLCRRAQANKALFHPDDLSGQGDYYEREGFRQ